MGSLFLSSILAFITLLFTAAQARTLHDSSLLKAAIMATYGRSLSPPQSKEVISYSNIQATLRSPPPPPQPATPKGQVQIIASPCPEGATACNEGRYISMVTDFGRTTKSPPPPPTPATPKGQLEAVIASPCPEGESTTACNDRYVSDFGRTTKSPPPPPKPATPKGQLEVIANSPCPEGVSACNDQYISMVTDFGRKTRSPPPPPKSSPPHHNTVHELSPPNHFLASTM